MPYEIYRLLHILGVVITFMALGAAALHAGSGGTRDNNPRPRAVAIAHGLGLLVVLVAGFGMLAKKFGGGLPGWVHPKLLIWLLLGAATALLARKPGSATAMWFILPLLAGVAAYLGYNHP